MSNLLKLIDYWIGWVDCLNLGEGDLSNLLKLSSNSGKGSPSPGRAIVSRYWSINVRVINPNLVQPCTWSIVKMPQPIFSHSRLTATNRVQNWHGNYLADKYGEEGSLGKSAGSDMLSFVV